MHGSLRWVVTGLRQSRETPVRGPLLITAKDAVGFESVLGDDAVTAMAEARERVGGESSKAGEEVRTQAIGASQVQAATGEIERRLQIQADAAGTLAPALFAGFVEAYPLPLMSSSEVWTMLPGRAVSSPEARYAMIVRPRDTWARLLGSVDCCPRA